MDCSDADDIETPQRMAPLKVYVAARYTRKDEVAELAQRIERAGACVCTDWFLQSETDMDDLSEIGRQSAAERDIAHVRNCDILVMLSGGGARGGRHFEFGYAMALGIPCWIVGPRENVFHWLPWVEVFDSADEMLSALREEAQKE
jgi:nucleoside 2-deoxyribosyltransferase